MCPTPWHLKHLISRDLEEGLISIFPLGVAANCLGFASSLGFEVALLFFQVDFHEELEVEANLKVLLDFSCLST